MKGPQPELGICGWGEEPPGAVYTSYYRDFPLPGGGIILALPILQQKLREQRQHVVAEFAQGHQFLREREQHLLDQLTRLEQELAEGREKCQARGSGELARLALVISELEGKAQQPAAELMQVRSLPGVGLGTRPGTGQQALSCYRLAGLWGPRLSSLKDGMVTLFSPLIPVVA